MRELDRAVELLRAGELVAIPTETVYGLGADASNPVAVAKIFAAKGRPADHPLIVHLPSAAHLDQWAREIPLAARRLAEAFWPGSLTLILKRQPCVPDAVTGGQDTVGLRVPDHPLTLDLLRAFGGGVAAPSANRFGRISPTCADHVRSDLGAAVALVLDGGDCRVGIESTIVDCSTDPPRILRPGALDAGQLSKVTGVDVIPFGAGAADAVHAPRVSGSLEAHYAPLTALRIVAASDLAAVLTESGCRRIGVLARGANTSGSAYCWRQLPDDPVGYAHDLYAALRALDAGQLDVILVERTPYTADWQAVNDRLQRAAAGAGAAPMPKK